MVVIRFFYSMGILLVGLFSFAVNGTELPMVSPELAGMDVAKLNRIDALVAEGLEQNKMPGCVICAGRKGKLFWLKAYGAKQVEPSTEPMTLDTLFDMASITKPVATATSVMLLVERGQLRLSEKVAALIPEFAINGKEEITVQDLLIHRSGLIADNPIGDYEHGPEEAMKRIYALKPQTPLGEKFIYSDVNYILLGDLIRRVSGQTVHEFSRDHLFTPLEMTETGYLPNETLRSRAAPTEKRSDTWIRGEVHDPRAFQLGGVAGHAGLFSTAKDMAVYAQMMLGRGTYNGLQIMSPQTMEQMTRGYRVPSGLRGLGWDKRTGYSSNRGDLLSDRAFGHGGFTGTVLWIDPELDLFFVFLSNRVHPHGKGLVNPLAGRIISAIAASIVAPNISPAHRPISDVLAGIDVLQRDNFRQLAGRKVGLITNQTGKSRSGEGTIRLLHQQESFKLEALFSPEHGLEGKLDIPKVADGQDPSTGMKVLSLYGETRRPTAEMLAGLDTLVFDIQDIGARFYTYVSTMLEAMRAADEHKLRFVVLDRPNPINGRDVAGPMLDTGRESFVAAHPLPVRHGMTMGELAQMFKKELRLDVELQVIACEGWQREDYWDQTGLVWVNPSPNMRSLTEAVLYPGIGLLEMTNISVGRGTDVPFEVIGAPWLEGAKLSRVLNDRKVPGVRFVPIRFTPTSSKFENEACGGVNLVITDRATFLPVRTGIEIAVALRSQFSPKWEAKKIDTLMRNQKTLEAIERGETVETVLEIAAEGLPDFLRRRQEFLIYP